MITYNAYLQHSLRLQQTNQNLLKKQLSIISSTYVFPFSKKKNCTSEIYTYMFSIQQPYHIFQLSFQLKNENKKNRRAFAAIQLQPYHHHITSHQLPNSSRFYTLLKHFKIILLFFDFPSSSSSPSSSPS